MEWVKAVFSIRPFPDLSEEVPAQKVFLLINFRLI